MEGQEESNLLLKTKYNLHASPEANDAAKRTRARTGERVPQDPLLIIQNYLNRFHEITDRQDPDAREHGMDAAKRLLHSKFVIKPDEVPESYFETQKRLAREQGHGDIEITQDMRDQLTDVIITDQKSSLDKWVDYLASPDAPYPDSLKYFTLRSVLSMGEFDKEKHAFTQRSKGTVKPFPDLNREALAYVLDAINKKYKGQNINLETLDETDRQAFEKLLQGENFAGLYAWATEKVTPASVERLKDVRGEWVKYPQNSDAAPLVASLQGYGTGWCTAGESTAEAQLARGDFYVYYSLDEQGKPVIPRLAIRMQGSSIAEVRGVAPEQNLDPYIGEVVEKKLAEFPDGALYKKKVEDMKRLTAIERKTKSGQQLSSSDVAFLYEIDSQIEGFGHQRDPRIIELREQRNPEVDMSIFFECDPGQIAHKKDEINETTRAYVGLLEPGIFDLIQKYNIGHVYTSFPNGKSLDRVVVGGKSKEQLSMELEERGPFYGDGVYLLECPDFTTLHDRKTLILLRLNLDDLGIQNGKGIPFNEVIKRAQKLGLGLCPPETLPQYMLANKYRSGSGTLYAV